MWFENLNDMISFTTLIEATQGSAMQLNCAQPVTELLTDSRQAISHERVLFFAIKGANHDGHTYIPALYAQGVRQFVVEHPIVIDQYPEGNFLLVENSINALQAVVKKHRETLRGQVVGITGSNGKTIVKEWLFQLMAPYKKTVKTPGSYNSQIGVPLSVWKASPADELCIFEAGISQPGEMAQLASIIQPTVGIFTNIGPAHDEGFENRKEKAEEKALLFTHCQKLIYCADHTLVRQILSNHEMEHFSWGVAEDATLRILSQTIKAGYTGLKLKYKSETIGLTFPFGDQAAIENAMHCVAFMLLMGYKAEQIQEGILELKAIKMRLELKKGINDCYIVDDSYNNDLTGLGVALDFINQQKQHSKHTLILSDILQSGMPEATLYRHLAELLSQKGVGRVIGIGENMVAHQGKFTIPGEFYESTAAYLAAFDPAAYQQEMVLIKGARVFGFERIVNKLQQKIHGTVLEINLNALAHNLNFYRSQLQPGTRVMAMVKAFAYGSGSHEVAHLLQYHKIDYLAVAYPDEGASLRQYGVKLPIMVMNPSEESFETLLANDLEPEIYSLSLLKGLVEFLNGRPAKIHLKIETGMKRLGFEMETLQEAVALLKANPSISVISVFSHLAGADSNEHQSFSKLQAARFEEADGFLANHLQQRPIRHLVNSAGILRFPTLHYDMVRLGIGLYGIEANGLQQKQLQNVSTLKTVVSQVKTVKKGDTVGYGRVGRADQDICVATIAIGYADGFLRIFGNGNAKVLVNGQLVPTIGNICMDMAMLNVTGCEVAVGDEVVVFGDNNPIAQLALHANTIPYEILTNVSERVKRIYYKD